MAFTAVALSAFYLSLPLPRNTITTPEPADQNQSAESAMSGSCSSGLEIRTAEESAAETLDEAAQASAEPRGLGATLRVNWTLDCKLRRRDDSQARWTRGCVNLERTSFHRLHLLAAFDLIET